MVDECINMGGPYAPRTRNRRLPHKLEMPYEEATPCAPPLHAVHPEGPLALAVGAAHSNLERTRVMAELLLQHHGG